MGVDSEHIIKRIDDALSLAQEVQANKRGDTAAQAQAVSTAIAVIEFASPPGSIYVRNAAKANAAEIRTFYKIEELVGILTSLKSEYEAGYLQTIKGLIEADVYSDFVEMAEGLLAAKYKDAAAVIAGSVLEEHLRSLARRNGVGVEVDGKYRKAESINTDLRNEEVYPLNDQKQVSAWLGIRNSAAHGDYTEYDEAQVRNMIDGIRAFMARHPA